jgi:hypothetical protein
LVQAKAEYVQCNGLKKSVPLHPIVGRHDLQSVTSLRESPSVADHSTSRNAVTTLSIRTFGDAPLGWRYPSVLERVRLIQVMPAMKIRDILDKP